MFFVQEGNTSCVWFSICFIWCKCVCVWTDWVEWHVDDLSVFRPYFIVKSRAEHILCSLWTFSHFCIFLQILYLCSLLNGTLVAFCLLLNTTRVWKICISWTLKVDLLSTIIDRVCAVMLIMEKLFNYGSIYPSHLVSQRTSCSVWLHNSRMH